MLKRGEREGDIGARSLCNNELWRLLHERQLRVDWQADVLWELPKQFEHNLYKRT